MIEWAIALGSALALGYSSLAFRASVRRKAAPEVTRAREGVESLTALLERPRYVRARSLRRWARRYAMRPVPGPTLLLDRSARETLRHFRIAHQELQERAQQARARFEAQEVERYRELFDTIESSPLTPAQRLAIVRNERTNLVLAGAGSGKTSTIVGKVGYLLRSGRAGPGEILVLAFAKRAKEELAERIQRRAGESVEVRTFHGLALLAVRSVEGRAPELSRLTDDSFLASCLARWLRQLCQRIPFLNRLAAYFAEHIYPVPQEETPADYPTLQGDAVRSWGEMAIANWLYLNGISYEYERPYEHDTGSVDHRQYRPDFYLPDARIYIEYFGVDETMKPRPGIDADRYRRGMEWKRELHKRHRTTLVECYAYEARRGVLISLLASRLMALGVRPQALPPDRLRSALLPGEDRRGYTSSFLRLIASFLRLFRANLWNFRDVVERASQRPDAARCLAFLALFRPFHRRFRRALEAEGAIDFDEMIVRGTRYLRKGRYRPAFRYVLVDEFQDLSRGRYLLLKQLLASPRSGLFAVGDDWQSIFRFTGSDVTLMSFFDRAFPDFQRTDLDRTFRFNQEL